MLVSLLAVTSFASEVETQPASTSAQLTSLSLEDLMRIEVPTVYGASKFEQKTTEAPSSVTVVTSEEIKRFGFRTLADVLQSVQGFYVSYDRSTMFLGTRGINLGDFNSRVLVLVDGHRINNNLTDGAAIGTDFILDVDLIERVEIIRGPGSVLYGNNAFFGVVNVITRAGRKLKGSEVSGEYGSFNTYKGRASYGTQLTNGIEWLVSGTIYHSDGTPELYFEEYDTPAQNNGVAEDADADTTVNLYSALSLYGFTLDGAFMEREKVNPTAQYNTLFNDSDLKAKDLRAYASLKYEHESEQVGDLTARLYYDQAGAEFTYPFPTSSFKEKTEGQWW
jgi:iron complex outermembrane receptor protein